jgi:hypothetical protein
VPGNFTCPKCQTEFESLRSAVLRCPKCFHFFKPPAAESPTPPNDVPSSVIEPPMPPSKEQPDARPPAVIAPQLVFAVQMPLNLPVQETKGTKIERCYEAHDGSLLLLVP